MAVLSPIIPGFNPMNMAMPQMRDPNAQTAMQMKMLMAALKPQGGAPGPGATAANTGVEGGGYVGPGGEVQPGPGFYPPAAGAAPGGMINQTGGIAGLLGGGAGGMGLLGKLLAKKPVDPNAMVDPSMAGAAMGGGLADVAGIGGW